MYLYPKTRRFTFNYNFSNNKVIAFFGIFIILSFGFIETNLDANP